MMRNKLFVGLMTSLLFSCGGNVYKSTQALDNSFASLKNSSSKDQWVESENNFAATLSRLEAAQVDSAAFCTALQERSVEDLVLIQHDLEESTLAQNCLEEVNLRVDDFFAKYADKPEIKPSKIAQRTLLTPVNQYKKLNGREAFIAEKEVILTFDDGPVVKNTSKIVELMKKWNLKVMFFMVGDQVVKTEGTKYAKYMKTLGHTMATHSKSHVGMIGTYKKIGISGLEEQIINSHKNTDNLLGGISPFFRFPGGTANPEIDAIVNDWGLSIWHWSIDSLDFQTPDPAVIVKRVIAALEKNRKGMLLFHDIHQQTAYAMPEILKYLADNNYTILIPVEK